ncbi:MAG: hypothetical protein ABR961_02615 [Thermoanaerobaculaceae bacterium]
MPRRETVPLALLIAFWALLYLPNLFAARTLPIRDVSATQLAWRTVWREQVSRGWVPLWDPCSNGGRPMLANPNAMAAYPGTLLFLVMTPEAAAGWHLALHHLILLLGCYRLARRCGAARPAAGVAAAATGTCGIAWSSLTFLNFQASLAWSIWALATAVPPPEPGRPALRRALAGGALLGLSFLGGEPVTAAFGALAWALIAGSTWRSRPWLSLAVGAGAAAMLAAPVLVPLLAIFPETVRGGLAAAKGALGADALAPRRFLELAFPNLLGSPLGDATSGFWARPSFPWQRYYPLIFLGAVPILCVPAAWGRRALAPWWTLVAAGTVGAAVLAPAGIAGAAQNLPLLDSVRYAIKFLVLPVFALTPLVAAGWQAIADSWAAWGRRYVHAATLVTMLLSPFALAPNRLLRPLLEALYPASRQSLAEVSDPTLARAAAADWLALSAPVAVVAVAGPAPIVLTAAALGASLLGGSGVLLFDRNARWAESPPARNALSSEPVLAVLQLPEPSTRLVSPLERFWVTHQTLVPESGTRWGIRYVLSRGPDGLEPVRQELLAAATAHMSVDERARVARALGANAVICTAPLSGWQGTRVGPLWVGAVANPSGRVYLARRVLPADTMLTAATIMASDGFRPGEDVVVFGSGGASVAGGGLVSELAGPPYRRRFDVRADGPGLLVVQQSFMACWRATVDGRMAQIEPVNGSATGIRVSRGRHHVELRIDPTPYRTGTAGPLLLLLTAALIRRGGSSRDRAGSSRGGERSNRASRPAQ